MNIFRAATSWHSRAIRKLLVCLGVMIVPEAILLGASMQLVAAKEVRDRYNEIVERQSLTNEIDDERQHVSCPAQKRFRGSNKEKWTLEHGFFAVMGGFNLELKEKLQQFDRGRQCTKVTPKDVILLAECNALPQTSFITRVIAARRKSDYIAKLLVCLQILWLVIQTIAQKFHGFPITLLEVNTLGLVWCALALYVIRWHKP